MHAQRFHAGIARGAVLFSHKSVLFAKFHQCLDMLGDKGNGCNQDVLAFLGRFFDFILGRRANPFQRSHARLVAWHNLPVGRHPPGDHLCHGLALPLVGISILHDFFRQTVR